MLYNLVDEDGVYVADEMTTAPYTKHQKWAKGFTQDEAVQRVFEENVKNAYTFQMIPSVGETSGLKLDPRKYRLLVFINEEWSLWSIDTLDLIERELHEERLLKKYKVRIEETYTRVVKEFPKEE